MSTTTTRSGRVRNWFGPARRRPVRAHTRLLLRALEDRVVPANFVVTAANDEAVDSDNLTCLREAAILANNNPGTDTITFKVSATIITVTLGEIAITDPVVIAGPGAHLLTVSGNNASRLFNVDDGLATPMAVLIRDLTLAAGNSAGDGGAIYCEDEDLTLIDSALTNNTAGGAGGAVYFFDGGSLTLRGCTISGNRSATDGGGVYLFDPSSVLIENTTVSGNSTCNRGGGLVVNAFQVPTTFTVRNSTITDNTAEDVSGTGGGGGMRFTVGASTPVISIVSSVVSGNFNPGGTAPDIRGTNVTATKSAIGSATGIGSLTADSVTTGLLGVSLGLGPLRPNGGPTQTHLPPSGSPLRDNGANPAALATDQRGVGFPRVVEAATDIGALESLAAVPTAAANAPDVTSFGGTSYTFTVLYTDDVGIDVVGSVGIGTDVTVTGPNNFSVPASYVSVSNTSNGSPRTATYSITPPNGIWDSQDVGLYQIVMNASEVSDIDPSPNAVPAGVIGTFRVGLPNSVPTAAANAANVTPLGQTSYTFTVVYTDDVGIDVSTVTSGDVTVTGPNGFSALATFVSVDNPTNGTPRTATYSITPPNGSWDPADVGVYQVRIVACAVFDVDATPNPVPPGVVGTFTVTSPPTAAANAADVTSCGGTSYSFTVVYTDDIAIDVSSIGNGDVTVTGPNSFSAVASFVSVNNPLNGTPRTVTYTITPPGGSWVPSSAGLYQIVMNPSQVVDTDSPPNPVPPGVIGSFNVTPLLVTNGNNSGPGSLRDAVACANMHLGPDTITFAGPLNIVLTTGQLSITDPLVIDGSSVAGNCDGSQVIVDSNTTNARVFEVDIPVGAGQQVKLVKLTVTGGALTAVGANGAGLLVDDEIVTLERVNVVNNATESGNGGGIAVMGSGSLTLAGCEVSFNATRDSVAVTPQPGSGLGAGVYNGAGANVLVTDSPAASGCPQRLSDIHDNTAAYNGGGIHNQAGGNVTVEHGSMLRNNFAGDNIGVQSYFTPPAHLYWGGGAISNLGAGTVSVTTGSLIDFNKTAGYGGGVLSQNAAATVIVSESTVSNNWTMTTGISGDGGGLYVSPGDLTVSCSTITGNTAIDSGGGIDHGFDGGNLSIVRSTISFNTATGTGGGVTARAGLAIDSCTFSDNDSGDHGGGLYSKVPFSSPTDGTVVNSTFGYNTATLRGGGISLSGFGRLKVYNCTVAENTSISSLAIAGGGGVYVWVLGKLELYSTIVAVNTSGSTGPDVRGPIDVGDHSNFGTTTGYTVTTPTSNTIGDPMWQFTPFGNYGGQPGCVTDVFMPLDAAPNDTAIFGRGNNVSPPSGVAWDQRGANVGISPGFARLVDAAVDIGAVERPNTFLLGPTPPTVVIQPPGLVNTPGGTSQQVTVHFYSNPAIDPLTLDNNDIIVTGPGGPLAVTFTGLTTGPHAHEYVATYTFTPPGGSWDLADHGRYRVTLNANQVFNTSAIAAPAGLADALTVAVPGTITVTTTADAGPGSLRAAIQAANANRGAADVIDFDPLVFAGPSTITLAGELLISDPVSIVGPGANKLAVIIGSAAAGRVFHISAYGGMEVSLSGLTMTGAAGIGNGGVIRNQGAALIVAGCSLSARTGASPVHGGAVSVEPGASGIDPGLESLSMTNSLIAGCVATAGGGGIALLGTGALTITNSTLSGNTAGQQGGAVFLAVGSTAAVRNSTIAFNTAANGGGVFNAGTFSVESITIGKNAAPTGPDVSGVVAAEHSLVGDASGATVTGSNNVLNVDPLLAPLAFNGGPTRTHRLIPGSPAINAGSNPLSLANDQRGSPYVREVAGQADIGAYEVPAVSPPTVLSVQVNNGAAQRSMVTSLKVTFSEAVAFPLGIAAAFRLERTGPGAPTGAVNLTATLAGSVVTITFAGGGPAGIDPGGSLRDGLYRLTVLNDRVQGAGGSLDGNGDGAPGDDYVTAAAGSGSIHRLFGDNDGDRDVDVADFGAFRGTFGSASNLAFDFDGDGDVDVADFGRFRQAFGTTI